MTHKPKKVFAEFKSATAAAAVLMLPAVSASQAADIGASGLEIVGIIDVGLLY